MSNAEAGQPAARISLEFVAANPGALTEAWFQGDLQARLTRAIGDAAGTFAITLNLEFGKQHVDERVLQPAMALFPQHPTGDVSVDRVVNRIDTGFYREGILTIRDLLATGRKEVGDIRNFGEKVVTVLDEVLANQDFGVEWGPDPTPATAAVLYKSLSEVPVIVLGYSPDSSYRTIEELLRVDEEDLARLLGSERWLHRRQAQAMLATAKQFASDFIAAKFGSAAQFNPAVQPVGKRPRFTIPT